jgi:hypothetical protein
VVVVVVLEPGVCYFYFVEGERVWSGVAEILGLTPSLTSSLQSVLVSSEKESGCLWVTVILTLFPRLVKFRMLGPVDLDKFV